MRPSPNRFTLLAALAAVGLTSTIGQLVLLRELVAVFYGNELVFGLILAAWLAWVAVGAWLLPSLLPPDRGDDTAGAGPSTMVAGLLAAVILLPAAIALVRASRSLLGVTPGALLGLGSMLGVILLCLAPLCLLLGWLFTLGARLLASQGGSVGGAYTAESLGAVAGGVLFSFLLVRWLNPFQIALVVGAVNLAAAALLLREQGRTGAREQREGAATRRRLWLAAALGTGVLLALAWPLGNALQQTTLGWQYTGLRFARDSIYGRIVVTGSGEQRVFFENGLLFFETQGVAAEEVAHLPLLALPAPRRVLLIGGGVSGSLAEILRHPSIEIVHYVELDPLVVDAARHELPPGQAAALDDPRLVLANLDGRRYVRALRGQEPFDAVILDLPEPATGQLNRFYTQEFFAEVRALIAPGGLFALSLPWQENYPGPALQRLGASVYRTLAAEFPQQALLPGEQLYLLASEAPVVVDPAVMSARLAERDLATRWVVPSYLDHLLAPGRVAQAERLLATAPGVRLNRDLEPVCYFYDLAVWLSRFPGSLSRLAASVSPLHLAWLALPLLMLVLLLRYGPLKARRRGRVPAVVALVGLAGMALEVLILFAFQVVYGYVYGQVGLIVTAFMAGLALGSAVANRWHWPVNQVRRWHPRHSPRVALLWIDGGLLLLALGFPLLMGLAVPAWSYLLLALLSGGLTGLAFPLAVACQQATGSSAQRTAGLLYGADLLGGCLGAVTASVLLVPILGIPHTSLAVALVAAAGLALLV